MENTDIKKSISKYKDYGIEKKKRIKHYLHPNINDKNYKTECELNKSQL